MKKRIASFTSGFFTALALSACLTTALAAAGKVTYNFANVAVDGGRVIVAGADITAANGQKIPGTILYTDETGGKTNYLPLRKISEFLGVEISYDSASQTIYLGKQPTASSAASSKVASAVPQNAKIGNKELILSRGGTLLPDDDPDSYRGDEKLFLDKNGELEAEWMVGDAEALQASDKKLLKTLENGDYPKNSKGESYGDSQLAAYVGYWPDLEHLAEYLPENRPEGYIRRSELQKERAKLNGLSEDKCPHEYTIPLYNSEGNIIGEYKVGCGGHESPGVSMTPQEAREAIIKAGQ